jgi:hypothetical protein
MGASRKQEFRWFGSGLIFCKIFLLGSSQSPLEFLIKILEDDRILMLRLVDVFSNYLATSGKFICEFGLNGLGVTASECHCGTNSYSGLLKNQLSEGLGCLRCFGF